MIPLNINLLFANEEEVRGMRPVKVLDITEGLTKNFHPDGLFSTDIFGKVGGEFRNRMFSYIDLRVPIFHPTLYKVITRMKSLYEEILLGKSFAVFNPETKDFEKSTPLLGETGYDFFCRHLPKMKFEMRDAVSRKSGIKLLEKYKDNYFITRLLVLPAGLRDYFVDETGKPGEDEINDLYRKVMKTCFSLETIAVEANLENLDSIRANLQLQVQAVYEHIITLLKGKKGAIQSHWTTRRIYNSTRNVITSHVPAVTEMGGNRSVHPNETVVGMYQFLRAAIPLAVKEVREKFSQRIFISQNAPVALINKKTLKREQVVVDSTYYDSWLTYDGIEKIFANFGIQDLRHKILEVQGYYMALLWKGQDGTFKMIFDIDDIPEDLRDKGEAKPITLTEMLYICVYELARTVAGFVTRYPVAGYGGIYPCKSYLRSTVQAEVLYELDDMWQRKEKPATEFPVRGDKFMDSLAPASMNLKPLGADFDGDKVSYTLVWSDDATEELRDMLNNWNFYVSSSGGMSFSMSDDVIEIILASMTKRIK